VTTTRNRLRDFIRQELLQQSATTPLGDEDDLLLSGTVDSLGVMRLVDFLESDFGLEVPPEDITIDHFISIDAMARYVESRSTG
jgi:acyl carrier protein